MINSSNKNCVNSLLGGSCHQGTGAQTCLPDRQGFTKNFFVFLRAFESLWHFPNKYLCCRLLVLFLIVFSSSCNKEEQTLVLNEDFLTVADLLQYCQGSCDETLDWEGNPAWVKGHILNFNNDSIKNKYYNDSSFLLQDIRNGMLMEIRVEENKYPVFEKIWPADHKNLFFIKGTAKSIIASDNGECTKGVILSLIHPDDINFE